MRTRKSARLDLSSSPESSHRGVVIVEPEVNPLNEEEKRMELATLEALQNPLIVNETMRYLSVQDLMACRPVNRMWKSLSSSILVKRDCFVVKLEYAGKKKIFQQQQPPPQQDTSGSEKKKNPPRKLKDLNNLIQTSRREFPCTNFIFQGGNLGDPEPQRFFRLYGESIQTLEFANISFYCRGGKRRKRNEEKPSSSCFTTKSVFRKILVNTIPNVKTMTFKGFDYNWTEKEKIELNSVTTFLWDGAKRTAFKILQGARNLQNINKKLTSADTLMIGKCRNEAALQAALFALRARLHELELKSERLLIELGN